MNTINKEDLLNGEEFLFNNERHCERMQLDDFREATISFFDGGSSHSWATGFKIEFNCKLIHSSKTFKSMENKLNKLISTWNLEQSE